MTCKDCIHYNVCQYHIDEETKMTVNECGNFINTADVVGVKHGQWLPQIVCGTKVWDCSECKTLGSPDWKRCPICEAKMDGGKEVRQNDL